jgi:hypothetical protein
MPALTEHRWIRTAVIAFAAVTIAPHTVSADDKREIPDYDGRGNPDAEQGTWALWIPRVALSPLYAVNEYVLRRPIGALVTTAEKNHWIETVGEIFTFGKPGHTYTLYPTALFDFGLLPSVGFFFSGDAFLVDRNQIRVHAATWGPSWISASAIDRYGSATQSIATRVEFTRRPDYLFLGIGPDVTDATASRYGLERFDAGLTFKQKQNRNHESFVSVTGGVRQIAFRDGTCCVDPPLTDRIADGMLPAPPGFDVPYVSLYQRADFVLDSRLPRPEPGSGVYLRLGAETDFDVKNDRSWASYGGVLGAAVDLNGRQRTIGLQVGVKLTDPIKGGVVPFNEMASLGSDLMPGFVNGWMTGNSFFATQLSYTWPIWVALDGETRFSMGNAFGDHLDGLSTGKLRMSGDIGITTSGLRDNGFEVLFGVGTETIDHGAGISSVRLTFGSRKGF